MTDQIPEGYMKDGKGRLVPLDVVKPIDIERNDTVIDLVKQAYALQSKMKAFKQKSLDEVQAFVDLSAEQYNKKLGGIKGNVQLLSYDGKYKVARSNSEYICFDERLQVAKELIDHCIKRWSEGSRPEIKALVQDAFQTDKQGKINTSRVLGLKRLDIQDKEWQEAMQAISDSTQTLESKTYVRLYERIGDSDQWKPIALDIAAL